MTSEGGAGGPTVAAPPAVAATDRHRGISDGAGITSETARPVPALSRADAILIIVGIVVGAGIFKTPSLVASIAGSATVALLLWVAVGAISLVGALCYAELVTRILTRAATTTTCAARTRRERRFSSPGPG